MQFPLDLDLRFSIQVLGLLGLSAAAARDELLDKAFDFVVVVNLKVVAMLLGGPGPGADLVQGLANFVSGKFKICRSASARA